MVLPQWLLLAALMLVSISSIAQVTPRRLADAPDDVAHARSIHIIYAVASDGTDRQLDTNGTLVRTVLAWNNWMRIQTQGRGLRIDTAGGLPDITFVRLPQTEAFLEGRGTAIREAIEGELSARGFLVADKLYGVYYDGPARDVCGSGAWPPSVPGRVGAVYLRGYFTTPGVAPCSAHPLAASPLSSMGYIEAAMIHEVLHIMGYVPVCSLNHALAGHVGDDPRDIMYAGPEPWTFSTLDIARNDYYGHGGADCPDLANDAALELADPPASTGVMKVAEFFNAALSRYFRTSEPAEAQAIRADALTGELDTGFSFRAWHIAAAPPGAAVVCRFYGSVNPGPNSHFFTADPGECAALRQLQATTPPTARRWNFEGNAFAVRLPVNGICPADAPVAIYRNYNNGFTRNIDSNHRFTTSQGVYQAMIAEGWLGEGIVMCAPA
jgi:hypothetical protein